MHVGTPRRLAGDYLGVDVNVAARVADGAGGGEVLVSSDALEELDGDRVSARKKLQVPGQGRPQRRHRLLGEAEMTDEPEILDETAIAADERAVERRAPDLMTIPRLLGGALNDLRTIADGMAVLPRLLTTLNGIQAKVDSLDDEVKRMRAAVDGMGGDVGELRDGIERLEPHLEDVTRVAHPLRRLGDRRRGRAED